MNNELMLDENFIRCSTMIAELLMKYKSKENEEVKENEEPEKDSSSSCALKREKTTGRAGENKKL